MKINKNALLLIFLLAFNVILYLLSSITVSFESAMKVTLVWIVVCYIALLRSTRRVYGTINFMYIWLLMTIPFFFIQQLTYFMGESIWEISGNYASMFLNYRITEESILGSTYYSLTCLIIITIFFVIGYAKNTSQILTYNQVKCDGIEINEYTNERTALRKVAIILVVITLVPTLFYWTYAGVTYKMLGYSAMKNLTTGTQRSGVLFLSSYISGWFVPSCYMLLVSTYKKYERYVVIGLLLIVSALILIAGSRYTVVKIACAYVLIDMYWINRGNKISIKKYAVLAVGLIIIMAAVRMIRTTGSSSGISFITVLSSILGDTDTPGIINAAAYQFVPQNIDYGYGKSYLYGFLAIFPNSIKNIIAPSFQTDITGTLLTESLGVTWSSYGSSFIAEAYYNFGFWGILIMPIYGMIMGKLVSIQKNSISSISPCKFVSYVYLCSMVVFAIRSEVSSIIRPYIYYIVLPMLVVKLLLPRRNH